MRLVYFVANILQKSVYLAGVRKCPDSVLGHENYPCHAAGRSRNSKALTTEIVRISLC